jgi:hypothetical protein
MLCRRCANLPRRGPAYPVRWPSTSAPQERAWDNVLCAICGTVLPVEDTTERLLGKLSQLARFGLASAPLFKPPRG